MLTLPIHKAVPGMVLSLPVMHPEKPGHVLLKPGCAIDPLTLERLHQLKVRTISIAYPPTAFLLRYASPAIMLEQSRLAERVAFEIDRMSASTHAELEFQTFLDGVRALIEKLVDDPTAAVFLQDVIDSRQPLASHAFNVGLLSIMIGLKLDGYLVANRARISARRAANIEGLGLGALLHDIGMTLLTRDVVQKFEADRDESDPQYQRHTILGFNIVKGRVPATASACVLHHHQRLDGSGFPRRVRGFGPPTALRESEIHIFPRIVAVADVFDRFRNPPGSIRDLASMDAGPVPTVRALKQTLDLVRARKLDAVVFKALLSVVPAFAPGSIVTLSDGRDCIVAGWDPMLPCSPTVLPFSGDLLADVRRAGPGVLATNLTEAIDLAERRDLRIIRVGEHDVSGDHFEPLAPGEFDLRLQYAAPLGDGWDAIAEATLASGGKLG